MRGFIRSVIAAALTVFAATALDHPETRKFFQANSFERVDLSPHEFAKLIQDDLKHWTALINAVGIKIE